MTGALQQTSSPPKDNQLRDASSNSSPSTSARTAKRMRCPAITSSRNFWMPISRLLALLRIAKAPSSDRRPARPARLRLNPCAARMYGTWCAVELLTLASKRRSVATRSGPQELRITSPTADVWRSRSAWPATRTRRRLAFTIGATTTSA